MTAYVTIPAALAAGFCMAALPASPAVAFADAPAGIYALGAAQDNPGTPNDERLSGIRDYDFVSGFTLRVFWKDIEPTQGAYSFTVIDQAVERVAAIGRHLNIEVLQDLPPYLVAGASATYLDHRGMTSPVPWDAFAQSRYAALQQAMSQHVVPGSGLQLKDHPVLVSVDASSVGLNFGVRDINSGIRTHPDYTQQRYIDSVVQGVAAARAAFPGKQGFLAFFAFSDNQPGPRVDEQLIERLSQQYNGPGQPTLAFFIENLSDNGPLPQGSGVGAGNNLLAWTNLGGDTMMQALDSWTRHQPSREPQLASHNAATGLELAFNTYGTRFVELYVTDLDDAAAGVLDSSGRPILADLRHWSEVMLATPAPACPADIGAAGGEPGHDDQLDNNDFIVFITYFFNRNPLADRGVAAGLPGSDGLFDNNDFIAFINEFFAGCDA